MTTVSAEFEKHKTYYCAHIDGALASYRTSLAAEDSKGAVDQSGFVNTIAEVTLGYVDIIRHAGLEEPIEDLLPNHRGLLECFQETSDAILKENGSWANAKYKSVIDRARNALLDLSRC